MRKHLFLLLLLAGCSRDEPPPEVIRPARYEYAAKVEPFSKRVFSGVTKAGIESKLSFRVPGRIDRRPVKVGDRVKKGDLIAELDPKDYLLEAEEAEAAMYRAQAVERKNTADYARTRELYETQSASRAELDASRAAFESGKASLEAAKTRLALAEQKLSYTQLVAPEAGDIAILNAEVNENVAPGDPIAVLNYGGKLEVVANVPESLIGLVVKGAPVAVSFDILPHREFPGKVTEMGRMSPSGTTFPITIQLDRESKTLYSGLTAEVALLFPQRGGKEGIYVPANAVREQGDERYLFVIHPIGEGLGKLEKRSVDVGNLGNEGIHIQHGVSVGDRILTAGVQFASDGAVVKIEESE